MTEQDIKNAEEWRPSHNPWLVAVVVTLAAFMEILDTTIVNVALPHIAGSLSASNDEATWALTSYLLANGIVLTISGWLGSVFGRKRYLILCVAMFTLTSFLCGMATSLPQLVLFRLLQGLFGGGMQPTQQAIIVDIFPPEKRSMAFGVTAIATIIAPILGPTLGGYITDTYDWRWIFYANVPVGIIAVVLISKLVEDPPWLHLTKKKIDVIGLFLIIMGLGALQIALDRGEIEDWLYSSYIRNMSIFATLGIVGSIIWLLTARNPIINLRVFKDRNFSIACVCISAMGGILYAGAVIIPQFTQTIIGYDATLSGLVLSPGGILTIIVIPMVGRLMKFVETRYIIALGFLIMALGFYYSSKLALDIDFTTLVYMRSAQTAGLAFLFVPISTMAYSTLPKRLNADATSLFVMLRNVFGSIGISISSAFIQRMTQERQSYLSQWSSPLHNPFNELISTYERSLIGMGHPVNIAHNMAIGRAYQVFRQQATVLAYSDIFITAALISIAVIPVCFLFTTRKGSSDAAVH